MPEDFSTIEHDFIQVKDHFSNCKFMYKERKSKLDFLQNIFSETTHDISDLSASAKQQLVDTKQVYKDLDQEMKHLSQEIYGREQACEYMANELQLLEESEKKLIEDLRELEELSEKFMVDISLNEEFEQIENDIKNTYHQIDQAKESDILLQEERLKEEEDSLKRIKQDLATRQKRLTIVNTECYIEEIYCWYEEVLNLMTKIFGSVSVQLLDDLLIVKVDQQDDVYEVVIKDRKVVEVNINSLHSEEEKRHIDNIKDYCNKVNDMKLIFSTFLLK